MGESEARLRLPILLEECLAEGHRETPIGSWAFRVLGLGLSGFWVLGFSGFRVLGFQGLGLWAFQGLGSWAFRV